MRTGKDLILATKPFAREIRWKSWFHTLSTLFVLLSAFYGAYAFPYFFAKLACSILSGLVMVRFFIIVHDYQHHAIFYQSFPAKIIFSLYGLFILAPPNIWKRSHDYHHNHNSKLYSASIGSYPIMNRQKFVNSSKEEQQNYLFTRHPLTLLFGYFSMFLHGMCFQSFKTSPSRHWDSLLALVLHVALGAAIFYHLGVLGLILSFIIPFSISGIMGAYLFYAQHNFPGVVFKNNTEWSYSGAAIESSSYMAMNPFWQWITGNIGFHHIHHLNSRIPFYRLPEVMKKIPELQKPKDTTLNPSDIIACLRLKLWDPELNRMIGLSELKTEDSIAS